MSRRPPKERVKNKKLKTSSKRWIDRQLNDPYVAKAGEKGYRSRAAFKLVEIDEKMKLLKKGMTVVDLGAAPGGWTQVALEKGCRVIALDILDMDEITGSEFIKLDFMDDTAPEKLKAMIGGQADLVISDMAPNTTGHQQTDHLRIMGLVEAALLFATEVLKPGGVFVTKIFQGGAQKELMDELKKNFKTIKIIKPPASRKESSEQYLVATGFKG
jgi:23S rRNA (uridine2552-2'-O)-methyltransferase